VKFITRFFFLIPLLVVINGCSSTATDPATIYKNHTEEQIFQAGELSLAKRQYSNAVQQFEALDALYPFGTHDEQAELDLIYAYYENDDVTSSAAAATRFIRIYPRSNRVDYAYYMKGLADFEQDRGWLQRYFPTDLSQRDPGTTRQAFDDFNRLLQLFPNSVYAPDARQRMIYLRNQFAKYELHIANYYFRRGAYVAAINRASYIIQHYDGSPEVENALGLMVKSYRRLGLTELANQSQQILVLNYSNGPVLKDLTRNF
jgi:outer membrane protein assembly factor BamD